MIQTAHKVAFLALSTPLMLKQVNIDLAVQFLLHSYIDHIEEQMPLLFCISDYIRILSLNVWAACLSSISLNLYGLI